MKPHLVFSNNIRPKMPYSSASTYLFWPQPPNSPKTQRFCRQTSLRQTLMSAVAAVLMFCFAVAAQHGCSKFQKRLCAIERRHQYLRERALISGSVQCSTLTKSCSLALSNPISVYVMLLCLCMCARPSLSLYLCITPCVYTYTYVHIYIYMRVVKLGSGPIVVIVKVKFWSNLKVRFWSKIILACFSCFCSGFRRSFEETFVSCVFCVIPE